jgi:hypothetical protein
MSNCFLLGHQSPVLYYFPLGTFGFWHSLKLMMVIEAMANNNHWACFLKSPQQMASTEQSTKDLLWTLRKELPRNEHWGRGHIFQIIKTKTPITNLLPTGNLEGASVWVRLGFLVFCFGHVQKANLIIVIDSNQSWQKWVGKDPKLVNWEVIKSEDTLMV